MTAPAGFPANQRFPSDAAPSFAAMTRKLTNLKERFLDGADLVIDFATLGEYGLELEQPRECERRATGLASGSPHSLHDRAGEPERLAA